MSRVPGWEIVLSNAIDEAARTPFAWGQHDCCTFAFDVAGRLTGQTIMDWRGAYHDAMSARRYLHRQGARRMHEVADFFFGRPLDSARGAQRGDLVLCLENAYGICIGVEALFVGRDGLHAKGLHFARLAWRV